MNSPTPSAAELAARAQAAIDELQRKLPLPGGKRKRTPEDAEALRQLCQTAAGALGVAVSEAVSAFGQDPATDGACWATLAPALTHAVAQMNDLPRRNAEPFQAAARSMVYWPIIGTLHKGIADNLPGESMLRQIELGGNATIKFDMGRAQMGDGLAGLAVWYIDRIGKAREALRGRERNKRRLAAVWFAPHPKPGKQMLATIASLPDFGPHTWRQWADVATGHLTKRLSAKGAKCDADRAALLALIDAPSRRKSPGRQHSYLRQQLAKKICGLAGKR